MNLFELRELWCRPPGDWKTLLMCNTCGKFYLSKIIVEDYRAGVECPVCLDKYPEDGYSGLSVEETVGPWFQTFFPEYPLDADNIKIHDE